MPDTKRDFRPFLTIGILALATFIGTGVYLRANLDSLDAMPVAVRHTHRANHVYILFTALLNLVAATSNRVTAPGIKRHVAGVSAILILASPVLMTTAFVLERSNVSPDRPLTAVGIFAAFVGAIGFVVGRMHGRDGAPE